MSSLARSCLALAIVASACEKRSLSPADGAAGILGIGAADGGSLGGAGGGSGQGAQAGQNPLGTAGGGGVGAGGPDGGGARAEERARTLAPLATSDPAIDLVSGAALFDLARAIGYARGYALCSCVLDREGVMSVEALDGCSIAESGFARLFEPMPARCIFEQSRELPEVDAYIRCQAQRARDDGRYWAACDAMGTPPVTDGACTGSNSASMFLNYGVCDNAFYCADGTFTMKGHCDLNLDCPDGADERGCGHFICGDKLVDPYSACSPDQCPVTFDPPLCAPNDRDRLLCGDGSVTLLRNACDGVRDCANGRDEAYCF